MTTTKARPRKQTAVSRKEQPQPQKSSRAVAGATKQSSRKGKAVVMKDRKAPTMECRMYSLADLRPEQLKDNPLYAWVFAPGSDTPAGGRMEAIRQAILRVHFPMRYVAYRRVPDGIEVLAANPVGKSANDLYQRLGYVDGDFVVIRPSPLAEDS